MIRRRGLAAERPTPGEETEEKHIEIAVLCKQIIQKNISISFERNAVKLLFFFFFFPFDSRNLFKSKTQYFTK